MSVESITRVWKHSQSSGTARVVLLAIADHDGEGGSWPSISTLARMANVKDRAVQRAIAELVAAGELIVHRNAGGTHHTPNDRRPNRYEITLNQPVDNHPVSVDEPVDNPENGVSISTPRLIDGVSSETERGVVRDANGVSPTTPEPPMNHPEPPTAAAAEPDPVDNPDQLAALDAAFRDVDELAAIRFDLLRPDQTTHLDRLITIHGIDRLVRIAINTTGTRPPRSVAAYIGNWDRLPIRTSTATTGPTCEVCNFHAPAHPWAGCHTFTDRRTA